MDTEPDYIDTVRPAAGQTAIYKYRGIFLLGDEEYGQWSDWVEMALAGSDIKMLVWVCSPAFPQNNLALSITGLGALGKMVGRVTPCAPLVFTRCTDAHGVTRPTCTT